jgi:hypothetical protein
VTSTEQIDWTKSPLPDDACLMGRAEIERSADGSISGYLEVANVPGNRRVPDKGELIDPHLFMPSIPSCRCVVTFTSFGQPGPLIVMFTGSAK